MRKRIFRCPKPIGTSQDHHKISQILPRRPSMTAQRPAQRVPRGGKSSPRAAKSEQERPKSDPRALQSGQSGPRAAKSDPRAAEERPRAAKSGPRAPKSAPRALKRGPRAAKSGQKRPMRGFWALLACVSHCSCCLACLRRCTLKFDRCSRLRACFVELLRCSRPWACLLELIRRFPFTAGSSFCECRVCFSVVLLCFCVLLGGAARSCPSSATKLEKCNANEHHDAHHYV